MRLVDDGEVSPGEVGELLARGPYTPGLLRRAGVQCQGVHVQWVLPVGRFDAASSVRELHGGRTEKDLINRGGEKISAEEIENLILTHPAVQNVAIADAGSILGERMCACVILRQGGALTLSISLRSS